MAHPSPRLWSFDELFCDFCDFGFPLIDETYSPIIFNRYSEESKFKKKSFEFFEKQKFQNFRKHKKVLYKYGLSVVAFLLCVRKEMRRSKRERER